MSQRVDRKKSWVPVDGLYRCTACGERFLALLYRPDGSSYLAAGRYVQKNGKLQAEGRPNAVHVCEVAR